MHAQLRIIVLLVLLACAPYGSSQAASSNAEDATRACDVAIITTEQAAHLPEHLLHAIGVVESGRLDPRTGMVAPWPWTINVNRVGYTFSSKEDAISAVLAAQASGLHSIDVGCMQINLLYHPNAFASLGDAFDPQMNVRYAASFLKMLFAQLGDWQKAAAAYHSRTPELGDAYARQVVAAWSGATFHGPIQAEAPTSPDRGGLFGITDQGRIIQGQLALTPARSGEYLRRLDVAAIDHDRLAQLGLLPERLPARHRIEGPLTENRPTPTRTSASRPRTVAAD